MMPAVLCVGTVLGALVGAMGVLAFDLSILAGVGVYFSIAFATMALGIIAMVQQDEPAARQSQSGVTRVRQPAPLSRHVR